MASVDHLKFHFATYTLLSKQAFINSSKLRVGVMEIENTSDRCGPRRIFNSSDSKSEMISGVSMWCVPENFVIFFNPSHITHDHWTQRACPRLAHSFSFSAMSISSYSTLSPALSPFHHGIHRRDIGTRNRSSRVPPNFRSSATTICSKCHRTTPLTHSFKLFDQYTRTTSLLQSRQLSPTLSYTTTPLRERTLSFGTMCSRHLRMPSTSDTEPLLSPF